MAKAQFLIAGIKAFSLAKFSWEKVLELRIDLIFFSTGPWILSLLHSDVALINPLKFARVVVLALLKKPLESYAISFYASFFSFFFGILFSSMQRIWAAWIAATLGLVIA